MTWLDKKMFRFYGWLREIGANGQRNLTNKALPLQPEKEYDKRYQRKDGRRKAPNRY